MANLFKLITLRSALFWFTAWYTFRQTDSIWFGLMAMFFIYAASDYKTVGAIAVTWKRDLFGIFFLWRKTLCVNRLVRTNQTVPMVFQATCKRHPNKKMLISEESEWTFRQVDEFTNKVAMVFHEMGFRAGDDVALYMENRPEYLMMWLGLSKIGVVTALLNHNQRSAQLVHSINSVNVKGIIFSSLLAKHVLDVYPQIKKTNGAVQLFCYEDTADEGSLPVRKLQPLIENAENKAPSYRGNISDKLLYIYTSGTTGLPKAAVIKHIRFLINNISVKFVMPIREDDVIYLCLPLYHGASGMLGIGQTIFTGITGVIVNKFSATRFWEDCAKYDCTVAQYIGETCRYLLTQPERETDKKHQIRLMYGNGLRPQIWKAFQDRFNISVIREIYGSTEAHIGAVNVDNKVGAIGFIPMFMKVFPSLLVLYPFRLIRVDLKTKLPLRDENGLCISAKPGEVGEAIAMLKSSSIDTYDGYADTKANSKKIYYDVLSKGDSAFSSGDLLVQDELGYLYFKDRTGDTFRWKGENVSTTEVEGLISMILGQCDVAVYGVEVPGCEGKAGMAAIVDPDRKIDLDQMLRDSSSALASYAVPRFVRILNEVDATSTYKLRKTEFTKEAFHITKFDDPVYFLDPRVKKYVPLTTELYNEILKKKIRL